MNFRVVNFRPIDDGWDGSTNPEQYFKHYEAQSHYDRQHHVKAWKNLGLVDIHSRGGHDAWFPELRIAPERFLIKHYPVRSQKQGEKKVFADRQPRWNHQERFEKGWHVQYNGLRPGHRFVADASKLVKWED